MNREQARQELNSRPLTDFYHLERSRNGASNQYICPICGSGSGKSHTGALTLYPSTNRLYCFKCADEPGTFGGKGQDTIGALRILWECDETEVFTKAGYTIDVRNSPIREVKPTKAPEKQTQSDPDELTEAHDYTAYYEECRKRLLDSSEAISYLQARGITLETASAYWLGYDPEWQSPKALREGKKPPKSPRIIMPTSRTHYVARDIRPDVKEWAKMNEGKPAIFNEKSLYNKSVNAIFVVEGIFDALSIIEGGGQAVALNSTSNARKLIDKLQVQRTNATLILCFDNDDSGEKCTQTIQEGLKQLNISYVMADVCNGCNDPNEALQKDRESFVDAIKAAERKIARPDNVTDYIDTIMSADIEAFREAKDRKTGFPLLDTKANGLYAGLYVVGAISSLGKTTFCTQLADQLAEAGEDVLFFSLEQSRLELVSKSLARRTAQKDIETAVDSLSIRRGYLPKQVLTAAAEYKQAIQDRLSIIEGNFQCNISFIGEYIRRYIRENGKKPVVFVDYLQILQPEKDERGRMQTTKETVDNTVTELKRISRENGLTVFVISSLNRSNYLSPVDFESFKESGGIEYTADVVWGLQLQSMNDKLFETDKKTEKRKAIKAAKAANPRKIELVCLKNRYGISNYSAYFDYYPQYDLYQETATPDYSLVTDDQEADYKPKKAAKTI